MEEKKVLVVDDEKDNRMFVQTILRSVGFKTLEAANGIQALQRSFQDSPDAIVLDIQLPDINGFEVFTRLRAAEKTKSIPVIMLTGIREKIGRGYSKHDVQTFFDHAPHAYLEKPVSPDALIEAVQGCF